jgi:hypothetical protein
MASAYPVAAFLIFALIGIIVFPIAWWLLAHWQRKRNLARLANISVFWSITPIVGFVVLYLGAEKILLPPMVAGITFFLIPVVNVFALAWAAIVSVAQVRNKAHDHANPPLQGTPAGKSAAPLR